MTYLQGTYFAADRPASTPTSAMPQYKLTYYDARGEAEVTRWIFAYGGIDYVDDRIKKEDWPERQKSKWLLWSLLEKLEIKSMFA